jgi:hypothetical protein
VSALALTGLLVFQDRLNAAAASSSRANAARDAVASESLQQVARSINLANTCSAPGSSDSSRSRPGTSSPS